MTSRFADVPAAPAIEVFAVNKAYMDDPAPIKVNLSIGAYRTNEGKPFLLDVVRDVERKMGQAEDINHEYLPILGLEAASSAATRLLLGTDHPAVTDGRVQAFGVQCLSGTGSLRIGADFLAKILGYKTYYISNPTWENHRLVFNTAGFTECREYRYWDAANRKLDMKGLLEDLNNAEENSVIILHACAHNPTGMDPTQDEWKQISRVMRDRKLFPFFDSAYQGFASGDPERDAWAVRYFAAEGHELLCAQSFAKNFGLYNERIGNLTVVLNDPKPLANVKSQLTIIVRGMYSNPPNHGARILAAVLNDPALYAQWKKSIETMSQRIRQMRVALKDRLVELGTPGIWDHITQQIGMFSYTGLTESQVAHLARERHIYLLKSGRANMCGLNTGNVNYVADSIHEAVCNVK